MKIVIMKMSDPTVSSPSSLDSRYCLTSTDSNNSPFQKLTTWVILSFSERKYYHYTTFTFWKSIWFSGGQRRTVCMTSALCSVSHRGCVKRKDPHGTRWSITRRNITTLVKKTLRFPHVVWSQTWGTTQEFNLHYVFLGPGDFFRQTIYVVENEQRFGAYRCWSSVVSKKKRKGS